MSGGMGSGGEFSRTGYPTSVLVCLCGRGSGLELPLRVSEYTEGIYIFQGLVFSVWASGNDPLVTFDEIRSPKVLRDT